MRASSTPVAETLFQFFRFDFNFFSFFAILKNTRNKFRFANNKCDGEKEKEKIKK
jgi:hypothetical protein